MRDRRLIKLELYVLDEDGSSVTSEEFKTHVWDDNIEFGIEMLMSAARYRTVSGFRTAVVRT